MKNKYLITTSPIFYKTLAIVSLVALIGFTSATGAMATCAGSVTSSAQANIPNTDFPSYKTTQKEWVQDQHDCKHFAQDFTQEAKQNGLNATPISLFKIGQVGGHSIVVVQVPDPNSVFTQYQAVEPQSGTIYGTWHQNSNAPLSIPAYVITAINQKFQANWNKVATAQVSSYIGMVAPVVCGGANWVPYNNNSCVIETPISISGGTPQASVVSVTTRPDLSIGF